MKRLLLAAFVLGMPAAQAVDYVKCDAIQKAYARADQALAAAAKPHVGRVYDGIVLEECGKYPDVRDGGDYVERMQAYRKCTAPGGNAFLRIMAAAYEAPEVAEWQRKLQKIKADYKKEDCP